MVQDSPFNDYNVSTWASLHGWSDADARDDLQVDSNNAPTDTSDNAKRHRNKAKGLLILQTQIVGS